MFCSGAGNTVINVLLVDDHAMFRQGLARVLEKEPGLAVVGQCESAASALDVLTASGATTYAWTSNPFYPFGDSTSATQVVNPPATTIFIVTGTKGMCSKTDSILVTVNPIPVVVAAPDTTVCLQTRSHFAGFASNSAIPALAAFTPQGQPA